MRRAAAIAVTRADVARRAGVSPAIVSYVLNDGPRPVSAEARERILAAVEELGYRPNVVAQALRGGGTKTVGLLTPSPANPYLAALAHALESEFFDRDYILAIGITDSDPDREERYLQAFLDRQVDALLLISATLLERVEQLRAWGRPHVFLDVVPESFEGRDELSFVHVDNGLGAYEAVHHLQEHGHTRIACIAGVDGDDMSARRVAAWRQALEENGNVAEDSLLVRSDYSDWGGAQACRTLMTQFVTDGTLAPDAPTAIFVASDSQAVGALKTLASLGLEVPRDIAVVSFDGTRTSRYERPTLTSYRQPVEAMAAAVAEHVIAAINHEVTEPLQLEVPGELVIGESCGCTPYEIDLPL